MATKTDQPGGKQNGAVVGCDGGRFIITKTSGQIIATSHDLTPNGGLVREIPLFQGNLGW